MESALGAFTKRLGEAKDGTGTLVTILNKNNKALLDNIKSAESTEDAFNVYIKALAESDDAAEKAALSSAAFGRTAGIKMVNLVKNGTKGLAEMRKEARDLGLVMDEDLLRQAEATKDEMTRFNSVLKTQVTKALIEMAPTVQKVTESLTPFLKTVIDLVASGLDTWFTGVAVAVKTIDEALTPLSESAGEDLRNNLTGVAAAMGAIGKNAGDGTMFINQLGEALATQDTAAAQEAFGLLGGIIKQVGQDAVDTQAQIQSAFAGGGGEEGEGTPADTIANEYQKILEARQRYIEETDAQLTSALETEQAFSDNLTAIVDAGAKEYAAAIQMRVQSMQTASSVLSGLSTLFNTIAQGQNSDSKAFFFVQRGISAALAFTQYQAAAAQAAIINPGLAAFYQGLSIAVPAAIIATTPSSAGAGGAGGGSPPTGGGTSIPLGQPTTPAQTGSLISGETAAQTTIVFNGPVIGDKDVLARELVPAIEEAIGDGVR
jgi:hypothetical protein